MAEFDSPNPLVPLLAFSDFVRPPNAPGPSGEFPLFVQAHSHSAFDAIRILYGNAAGETLLPSVPAPEEWIEYFHRGFLWIEEASPKRYSVVGAALFHYAMDLHDAPPGWELAGVWLAPQSRQKGLLSRSWPWFLQKFGSFHVHAPNPEMKSFLIKVQHPGTPRIIV